MLQNVEELMLLDWLQFKRDDGQIKQNTEVVCIALVNILKRFSFLTYASGTLFRM